MSKSHCIFTKFFMRIDIVENCFGLAQIPSTFYRFICPPHDNGNRTLVISCMICYVIEMNFILGI